MSYWSPKTEGGGIGGDKDSDSDIEVVKEVSPDIHIQRQQQRRPAPNVRHALSSPQGGNLASSSTNFNNPSGSRAKASEGSSLSGHNNLAFYTGSNAGQPATIQIVNGSYERNHHPATQVNIQMTPIIVNHQQTTPGVHLVQNAGHQHQAQSSSMGSPNQQPQNSSYYIIPPPQSDHVQLSHSNSLTGFAVSDTYQCQSAKGATSSINSSYHQSRPGQMSNRPQSGAGQLVNSPLASGPSQTAPNNSRNPLWDIAKILLKARYSPGEVNNLIKEKGMNCFYAVKADLFNVNTDDSDSLILFKCHFYASGDRRDCLENFSNNMLYMNHIDSHFWKSEHLQADIQTSTCRSCFMRFPNKETLMTHSDFFHSAKTDTNGKHFACHICDYTFIKTDIYMRHMFELHEVAETPYVCRVCQFATSFYSHLIFHFRSKHLNTKWFLCRFCFGVFASPHKFCEHIRDHLPRKNNVKCTRCRLIFVKQALNAGVATERVNVFSQQDHVRLQHNGLRKITLGEMQRILNYTSMPSTVGNVPNSNVVRQNSPTAAAGSYMPRSSSQMQTAVVSQARPVVTPRTGMSALQSLPANQSNFESYRPYSGSVTRPIVPRTPGVESTVRANAFLNANRPRNAIAASYIMSHRGSLESLHGYRGRPPGSFVSRPRIPSLPKQPYARMPANPPALVPAPPVANSSANTKATPDVMITIKFGWSVFLKFDGGFVKVRGKMRLWKAGLLERCLECGSYVSEPNRHFTRLMDCMLCEYSTYCPRAAISHFGNAHGEPKWSQSKESMFKNMDCTFDDGEKLRCFCGFESQSGQVLAGHVYFCRFGECDLPEKGKPIKLSRGGTLQHSNEKFSIKSLPPSSIAISALARSFMASHKPVGFLSVPTVVTERKAKDNSGAVQLSSSGPQDRTADAHQALPAQDSRLDTDAYVSNHESLTATFDCSYDNLPVPSVSGMDNEIATVVPAEMPANVNVLTGQEEQPNFPMDVFKVPVFKETEQWSKPLPNRVEQLEENGRVAVTTDDVKVVAEVSPLIDAVSVLPNDLRDALFDNMGPNGFVKTVEPNSFEASAPVVSEGTRGEIAEAERRSTIPGKSSNGGFLSGYLSTGVSKENTTNPPKKKARKLDAAISNLIQKQTTNSSDSPI